MLQFARESSRNRARELSRGTLDLRFAGYRCRTSKEERSSRLLAKAKPMTYSVSLSVRLTSPHFCPLAISCCFCFSPTTARKRGPAAVVASLAIGRIEKRNATNAEAPTQRRPVRGAAPKILGRRNTADRIRKSEARG